MMRHLALAALLAMPAVALYAAQPPYIHFTAATGPVAFYEARVRTRTVADTNLVAYGDVRYLSPDATPEVELAMLPPDPHWIDVRACNEVECGDWSITHDWMADLDEDGIVGVGDFIVLSQEWGDPERGAGMFVEMVRRWGDATVLDEWLGLRRYVDE